MAPIASTILQLLLMVTAPMVLFVCAMHRIEKLTQRRLAERFGWRSVMWTGWLGTPIHELSHVVMCWVFRHRIDDVALFEPDEYAGRLGFVRHSFRHGNTFEELGNFFIGLAPLAGGTCVLSLLLWLFYPDAAWQAIQYSLHQPPSASATSVFEIALASTEALCAHVFTPEHLQSGRFWGFMYLVICVGSHMAPSRSDYAGAKRGLWIFLAGGLTILFVIALALQNNPQGLAWTIGLLGPLLALMLLTLILCSLAAAVTYALTSFFPVRFEQI